MQKYSVYTEAAKEYPIMRNSEVNQCYVYPGDRVMENDGEIDVIVPIKEELKRNLIFGIQARPAIGMILSFFGYSYDVFELLQTLSHSTRAFIFNAKGLKGFLVNFDLWELLNDAYESGKLQQALSH